MTGHALILANLGRWGMGQSFQARCTCRRWESSIEDNRPDVIRQHTVHAMNASRVIFA